MVMLCLFCSVRTFSLDLPMPSSRFLVRFLFVVALVSPLVRADDYSYLGFQAGTGRPVGALGDWSGSKPGFGYGLQQLINEGDGTMLRTRIDLLGGMNGHTVQTLQSPSGQVQAGLNNQFTVVSLGLDSLWYFQGDLQRGGYLFGGVGGASTRLTSRCDGDATGGAVNWPASGTLTTTSNKFMWSAGLGWQYDTRIGAELRYVMTRFSYQDVRIQDAFVTLGVTFRFAVD